MSSGHREADTNMGLDRQGISWGGERSRQGKPADQDVSVARGKERRRAGIGKHLRVQHGSKKGSAVPMGNP